MMSKFKITILAVVLVLLVSACSTNWTKTIAYGSIVQNEINETVDIEITKNLIIIPISIQGEKYRFLFDTGAPFSISNKIQKDLNFKTVSKSSIVDSDRNKKKVSWVKVDSSRIGDVLFLDQTAFVGDFESNPILKCLQIDGIIGSNLIRHTNWTIDQERKTLSLFSSLDKKDFEKCISIPFTTDHQYNMFIDVHLGQSKVKHVLVDYGSNGSIALNNKIFDTLEDEGIIEARFVQTGVKQSGIVGTPVNFKRKITFSDSISINELEFKNALIRTGKTVSIGNLLLSRSKVSIDWKNQKLYFSIPEENTDRIGLAGFSLGTSSEKGIYVQSVIGASNAYKKGVRPNMKVVKVDDLDFENGSDYCDYVKYNMEDEIFIQIIDTQGKRVDCFLEKTY